MDEFQSDIRSANVTNRFVVYIVSSRHLQPKSSACPDSKGVSLQNLFRNMTQVVVHNRRSSNEDVRGMALE